MEHPNFYWEKKILKKGYRTVAGVDEVGRGALAGPVLAVAVMIDFKKRGFFVENWFSEINDSKTLSFKKREKIYKLIIKNPFICWGEGKVSNKIIDKINILEATKLAMKKAIKNLEKKYNKKIDFLVLDGKMKLDINILQKSIVGADKRVISCAIASIIAKIKRDRLMTKYHQVYPCYGFDKHKGYGVKYHIRMIKKYGPTKIHRKSFSPIKNL